MDTDRILSDLSRRYKRNALILNFIITALLVAPGIDIGSLTLFGVSMGEDVPNKDKWIWSVILALLAYQLFMFYIYSRHDRLTWIVQIHSANEWIWVELLSKWYSRRFRYTDPDIEIVNRTISPDGGDLVLTFCRGVGLNNPLSDTSINRIELAKAKAALHHYLIYEVGALLLWTGINLIMFARAMYAANIN